MSAASVSRVLENAGIVCWSDGPANSRVHSVWEDNGRVVLDVWARPDTPRATHDAQADAIRALRDAGYDVREDTGRMIVRREARKGAGT